MAFMTSPSLSLSSHSNLETSTISASPALLPNPPFSSPSPTLSPDITPLLPSPGGSELSPSGSSSMPTIPSNPSPPNPDEMDSSNPMLAVSPSGSIAPMSSASTNLFGSLNFSGFLLGLMVLWFLQLFGN
ncbi:hypothetical protein BVC80_949g98 [Macleaya cordata]|uniref:Uncharacterized protein n=1 Tax=Macleaya cordata TaxID=56857 RepID=A0A200QXC8_MACCD|nr:hypothetical protein BVC80_949g98 [Macleaya cordata]